MPQESPAPRGAAPPPRRPRFRVGVAWIFFRPRASGDQCVRRHAGDAAGVAGTRSVQSVLSRSSERGSRQGHHVEGDGSPRHVHAGAVVCGLQGDDAFSDRDPHICRQHHPVSASPAQGSSSKCKNVQNFRYLFFSSRVVPTYKHGWSSLFVRWFVHRVFPTELKAFTNFAFGTVCCNTSISEVFDAVLSFSTPFTGGSCDSGLVTSMTLSLPGFLALLLQVPVKPRGQQLLKPAILRKRQLRKTPCVSARIFRFPFFYTVFLRIPASDHDLLPFGKKCPADYLSDNSRPQYSNFHLYDFNN